jgi:hypothetical protein
VGEERQALKDEHEQFEYIALQHPDCIDASFYTYDNYISSFLHVSTRTFGYSLPEMMVVPFADNANHHVQEACFEIFNSRLQEQIMRKSEQELRDEWSADDQKNLVKFKNRVNFFKNFTEDDELLEIQGHKVKVPSRTQQYSRIIDNRQKARQIGLEEFKSASDLVDKEIWELQYQSTSDQQDEETDSTSSEEESDYDDEDNEEKKKNQADDGKVPEVAKKLRRDKVMRQK